MKLQDFITDNESVNNWIPEDACDKVFAILIEFGFTRKQLDYLESVDISKECYTLLYPNFCKDLAIAVDFVYPKGDLVMKATIFNCMRSGNVDHAKEYLNNRAFEANLPEILKKVKEVKNEIIKAKRN